MKKIITTGILLLVVCINAYCQDTSKLKNKKSPLSTKNYGPYNVTVDNGKVTLTKNTGFDASKILKRDTSSKHYKSIFEIYPANSTVPKIKKYFIYDANSVSSEVLMSKQERLTKYNSRAGVLIVHLKPGVVPIVLVDLLNQFKIAQKNFNLPVYVDYKSVANPDDLLAVSNAVLKIETVTDIDSFRFINITTKEWMAEKKKHAKEGAIYIK